MRKHTHTTSGKGGALVPVAIITALLPFVAGCSTTTAMETQSHDGAYPLRLRPVAAEKAAPTPAADAPVRHPGAYPLRA